MDQEERLDLEVVKMFKGSTRDFKVVVLGINQYQTSRTSYIELTEQKARKITDNH